MGYKTRFSGELKFNKELSTKELAKVKTFLGEDCRQHPEWGDHDLYWIDLDFTKDFCGLEWKSDDTDSYGMVECVNLIITNMRKEFPDFGLQGKMIAQGEDIDDRWMLVIENGIAVRKELDSEITCPKCGCKFNPEQ